MSKSLRWVIYSILIVAAVVFGFYVTFYQDPGDYTPGPKLHNHHQESAPNTSAWTARISGTVEDVRLRGSDEETLSLFLRIDDLQTTGQTPVLPSPVQARASTEVLQNTLGRLPEAGDHLTIHTQGSSPSPTFLTIDDVEFSP